MSRRRLLVVVFLFMTIGAAWLGGESASAAPPPGQSIAQDLASLVGAAPLVLVGKVVNIQPGRAAGQGEARLQFNDVQVRVIQRLKGTPAEVITVEQVAPSRGEVMYGIGPPYRRGVLYLLFLRPGEAPRFITIPQGRYLLIRDRVWPAQVGPVADRVKGIKAEKFIAEIKAIIAKPP